MLSVYTKRRPLKNHEKSTLRNFSGKVRLLQNIIFNYVCSPDIAELTCLPPNPANTLLYMNIPDSWDSGNRHPT